MQKALNFLLVAAALLLITAGVPQLFGAVWMAAGDPIWADYREGREVSAAELADLEQTRQNAIQFSDDNEAREQLAYLYSRGGFTAETIQRSIAVLEEAVAKDPLDASDWGFLVKLYLQDPSRHPDAIAAWKTSRRLAPNKQNLLNDRAANAIYLFRILDAEDRALARADLELAYRRQRSSFRRYMVRNQLIEWAKLILNDPVKTAFLNRI